MMHRRGFLGALAGLIAAPLAKLRRRNTLITPEWISRETARQFAVHFDWKAHDFPRAGVGDTITVKLPERFRNA